VQIPGVDMDEQITKTLEQSGLTKNETAIYLFLLKYGSCTSGPIIRETRITNSRVYESLHSLISQGLVRYTVKKDGKHFEAVEPSKFFDIEEERREKLAKIMPLLNTFAIEKKDETTSTIYEGFDGFKTAFKKIVSDCPKGETICILGFSEQQYANKSLRSFITNMNLKSAEKKQRLKILMDQGAKHSLGKDRAKEKFVEVKYMPQGYISPAAIDIFQEYIYIFLWEEKPYVFVIKNKIIAGSFKQYFNFLWSIARK